VAGSLERKQPCSLNLVGDRLAVCEWEHGIGGTVDDERRHPYRRQWPAGLVVTFEQVVILKGGEVVGALDVTSDEVANVGFLERSLVAGATLS